MEQGLFLENDNPVEYLYLDKQRISSLIGQLSEKGVLTGLKSTVSKAVNREAQAGGTLPGLAQMGGKRSRTTSDSAEETYDTFWANAFSFLRQLEANYAVPLDKARLGSLVKFDAFLQFVDLRIIHSMWGAIAQARLDSLPVPDPSLPKKKQREMKPDFSAEEKLGLALLPKLPHLLHMTFLAADENTPFRFWAALNPEHLTITSEDLTMKFGAVIDGKWTVVGIVDGGIGDSSPALPINDLLDGVIKALVNVREMLGRPKDHWGITPYAIYTPIAGIAEIEASVNDDSGTSKHSGEERVNL